MKMKLLQNLVEEVVAFWCPGCECYHRVTHNWSIVTDPMITIRPSVLTTCDGYYDGTNYKDLRCHLFITNSRIEYLSDCKHKLAGQTVDMIDTEILYVGDAE